MGIKFEGDPPYDLPVAQTAYSRPRGEIVEVILIVSVPGIQPEMVEVRVPMSRETAQALGAQLNLLSPAAWTTVSPGPVVVNGHNAVTNPIAGTQQFYRLSQ